MSHRRRWALAAGLALCLTAILPRPAGAAPAPAPAARQTQLRCGLPGLRDEPSDSSASFTGTPDGNDVAVGAPGTPRGRLTQAGMVEVRYSCAARSGVQNLRLPTSHRGDRFGAAITAAHLNGDVYTDLVVGVPGLDVGKAKDAGGIAMFLGSPAGLVYARTLTQASPGMPGGVQAGAHFGAVLSFEAERWWDDEPDGVLGIGAPDKDVGGVVDAGAVVEINTLSSSEGVVRQELTLDSPRVPGAPGVGDHLGAAIDLSTGTFGIGLPGRKVNGHHQAGAVLVARRDDDSPYGLQLVTQDTRGFAGTAETGDRFGAALAGGWIGVPGEDVRGVRDAGLLQSQQGDSVHQETDRFPGRARAGDQLGAALSVWVPPTENGTQTVKILAGMPGKDVAGVEDAGAVLSFRFARSTYPRIFAVSVAPAPDPEPNGHFGSAMLRAGTQVLVGAPGAAAGRGRVAVYDCLYENVPLALRGQWTQATAAARTNRYGTALGGIPNLT
ncbi:hypothetical protein [uncultured Friedmanniella sp.]|uniref:hypothetical protein n=1 Tax=uncultured Friedmanniella sp. TaxID=335381 RepID=UPI0035CC9008